MRKLGIGMGGTIGSGSMRGKGWIVAGAFFVAAAWAGGQELALSFVGDVVRVDASWPADAEELRRTALAGGVVSVQWSFVIERLHAWWRPNETVGKVRIVRLLRPDLLSGRFFVEEQPSEVVMEFSSLDAALDRLLHLRSFPLLDRALLQSQARYRITLEVFHFDGTPPKGWWARLWLAPEYRMSIEFRAP